MTIYQKLKAEAKWLFLTGVVAVGVLAVVLVFWRRSGPTMGASVGGSMPPLYAEMVVAQNDLLENNWIKEQLMQNKDLVIVDENDSRSRFKISVRPECVNGTKHKVSISLFVIDRAGGGKQEKLPTRGAPMVLADAEGPAGCGSKDVYAAVLAALSEDVVTELRTLR